MSDETSSRVLSRQQVYRGRVIALEVDDVEEPGGVRGVREIVRQAGSVAALPVHEDGRVVLIRQWRHSVQQALWELPAGRLDPGESPERGAHRELAEETGLRAAHMELIADFYTTPGFCDERMWVYRATGLTAGEAAPEEDEKIEVATFTRDELRAMVADRRICEGKTLVAALLEIARGRG